ncbi:unnamed protein product [Leptosia nina]|uniref:Secreted protein n=1 Tax=Leptosia nina TaxID=320188 RepID=A0AAV1IUY8_9NEOP
MKRYIVLIAVLAVCVYSRSIQNGLTDSDGLSRVSRQVDDDYEDEGGYTSHGRGNDHDFIANANNCPSGTTRTPWGSCMSCYDYQQKFGHTGANC